MNTTQPHCHRNRGFTLIEVCVALAIFTIALVSLLGMIPFTQGLMQEGGARAQWDRLQGQLRDKVCGSGYTTAAAALDNGRVLYVYRSLSSSTVRADGSCVPDSRGNVLLPEAVARWENDPLLADDVKALSGPLFRVKLERFPAGTVAGSAVTPLPSANAIPVWAVAEQTPTALPGATGKFVARKVIILQP